MAIPRSAPHSNAAAVSIDIYMVAPQNPAKFAREMGCATTSCEGLALLPLEQRHDLVSSPAVKRCERLASCPRRCYL